MSDYTASDYAPILARAKQVFGHQPFELPQLRIEINRRSDELAEAIAALVAGGRLEQIDGPPILYKVKEN